MKISINQSELQNALAVVVKGSSNRSTLPILAGIHMQAQNQQVVLQSTNLELSIKLTLPALVEEEGETVVPAKLFLDIVKNLPDMAVSLETVDNSLTLFCNSITFSLKTLNPSDFPAFPELSIDQQAQFPFNTFADMVKSTAKIVSKDEDRQILTGVLIHQEATTLKMVSTDSYRLAVAETELQNNLSNEFQAVISGSFLQEISALPKSDELLSLGLNDNQIIITYQNVTFVNRRIEGVFPNYKQLINNDNKTRLTIQTQALIEAVRRISLLSNSPIQMNIDANTGILTLFTNAQDIGNAQETILCEIEGESVDIAFNYSFILDGLNSIKSSTVYLDLFGAMKPGIFRSTDKENYLYLIMPVRV